MGATVTCPLEVVKTRLQVGFNKLILETRVISST